MSIFEKLIFFLKDNKKKVEVILVVIAILFLVAMRYKKSDNKIKIENKINSYDEYVTVEVDMNEVEYHKELELRGGDPFGIPNYNLIEKTPEIKEVFE